MHDLQNTEQILHNNIGPDSFLYTPQRVVIRGTFIAFHSYSMFLKLNF